MNQVTCLYGGSVGTSDLFDSGPSVLRISAMKTGCNFGPHIPCPYQGPSMYKYVLSSLYLVILRFYYFTFNVPMNNDTRLEDDMLAGMLHS